MILHTKKKDNGMKVSDDLDELLVVVDESDQVIGSATRMECHRNPDLIHRAAYVLIFNSEGKLFLHKRSQTKDTCPGMWSISVAGHVGLGESYKNTITREMKEEIGAVLDVEFVDKFLLRNKTENEYSAIYKGYAEGPFKLNPLEIEAGEFFSMGAIRDEMWGELTPFSQTILGNLGLV